jgi:hypothetical protein
MRRQTLLISLSRYYKQEEDLLKGDIETSFLGNDFACRCNNAENCVLLEICDKIMTAPSRMIRGGETNNGGAPGKPTRQELGFPLCPSVATILHV